MITKNLYGVWIIDNFADFSFCNDLILNTDQVGFSMAKYYNAGRRNQEVFLKDRVLHKNLLKKLMGLDFGSENLKIIRLSYPIEIYKYLKGDYITEHTDSPRDFGTGIFSSFTLIVYLNDDFEGGKTRFSTRDQNVVPQTGTAIIFDHNLPHESLLIETGIKYILRADLAVQNPI